jgi:hypothetical protein
VNDEAKLLTPPLPSSYSLQKAEIAMAKTALGLCVEEGCERRADDEEGDPTCKWHREENA